MGGGVILYLSQGLGRVAPGGSRQLDATADSPSGQSGGCNLEVQHCQHSLQTMSSKRQVLEDFDQSPENRR
jgi:hypothetical protein